MSWSLVLVTSLGLLIVVAITWQSSSQTRENDEVSVQPDETSPHDDQPEAQFDRHDLASGTRELTRVPTHDAWLAMGRGGDLIMRRPSESVREEPSTDSRARLERGEWSRLEVETTEPLVDTTLDGHLVVFDETRGLRRIEPNEEIVRDKRPVSLEAESLAALAGDHEGRVAIGDREGNIEIYDFQGSEPRSLEGHHGAVHHLLWAPELERLVSGSRDGTVRLWSLEEETLETCWDCPIQSLEHDADLENLALSGERLALRMSHQATSDHDRGVSNTIRLWHLGVDRETLCWSSEVIASARDLAFSRDGSRLVVALVDGLAALDLDSGQILLQDSPAERDIPHTIDINHDEGELVTGSESGVVRLWDLDEIRASFDECSDDPEASNELEPHPDDGDDNSETPEDEPSPSGERGFSRSVLEPRDRRVVGTRDSLTDLLVAPWWIREVSRRGFRVYDLLDRRRQLCAYREEVELICRRATDQLRDHRDDIERLEESLESTKNRSEDISADPSAIDDDDVGQALETRQSAERDLSDIGGRAQNIRELTHQLQSHRRTLQKLEECLISGIQLYRAVTARLFQRTLQVRWAVHVDALARRLEGFDRESLDHEASDRERLERLESWSELLFEAADYVDDRYQTTDTWAERHEERQLHDVSDLDEIVSPHVDAQTLSNESDGDESLVPEDVHAADRTIFETRRQSYMRLYEVLIDALRSRAESLEDKVDSLRNHRSEEATSDEDGASDETTRTDVGDTNFGTSDRAEWRQPDFGLELEIAASGFETGGTRLLAQYGRSDLDASGEGPDGYAEALERIAERVYRADPIGVGDEGEDDRPDLEVVAALARGEEVDRLDLHDWTGRVQRLVSSWIG